MGWILCVDALTAAEVGLVQTILRLSSELQGQWQLGRAADCQVLLSSGEAKPAGVRSGCLVVPVVRRELGEISSDVLHRPIRAEELLRLLVRAQTMVPEHRTRLADWPPNRKAVLRRWPTPGQLGGSMWATRLAGLLVKRSLSAADLSHASGVALSECLEVMKTLESHGLLKWEAAQSDKIQPAPPALVGVLAAGRTGLLESIRRRLGILVQANR